MDRKKTVGRKWKRQEAIKAKDEKEKEQEEGHNNKFVISHLTFFIQTDTMTEKRLFADCTPVHSHIR